MFIRQIKIPQSAVSEPVGITREIPTLTHTINLIVAASYRVPGIARRAVRVLHPFYERFIHIFSLCRAGATRPVYCSWAFRRCSIALSPQPYLVGRAWEDKEPHLLEPVAQRAHPLLTLRFSV